MAVAIDYRNSWCSVNFKQQQRQNSLKMVKEPQYKEMILSAQASLGRKEDEQKGQYQNY